MLRRVIGLNSLVRLKRRGRVAYAGYLLHDEPAHSKIGLVVKTEGFNESQIGYWVDILWSSGEIDSQLTSYLEPVV